MPTGCKTTAAQMRTEAREIEKPAIYLLDLAAAHRTTETLFRFEC